MTIDINEFPNLMNLLSLPFVCAGQPKVYDEDSDAEIDLCELILAVREELGLDG